MIWEVPFRGVYRDFARCEEWVGRLKEFRLAIVSARQWEFTWLIGLLRYAGLPDSGLRRVPNSWDRCCRFRELSRIIETESDPKNRKEMLKEYLELGRTYNFDPHNELSAYLD